MAIDFRKSRMVDGKVLLNRIFTDEVLKEDVLRQLDDDIQMLELELDTNQTELVKKKALKVMVNGIK